MAEIDWKGAVWRGAFEEFSLVELLTILKGFGPMEVLEFEKPGHFRGQMSLCLTKEGAKEITLFALEVHGDKRKGHGREALRWLKEVFKGELFAEDAGTVQAKNATEETLLFWIRMYREGLVNAVDGERYCLLPHMSGEEITRIEQEIRNTRQCQEMANGVG